MTSTLSQGVEWKFFCLEEFVLSTKTGNYISIAIFAFFGGIARAWLNSSFGFYGTFWGNIIGCFLLAFFTYLFMEFKDIRQWLAVGLGTGFVGAFTTFSTFNLDVLKNIQANVPITALIYFLSSVIFGFCFAYLGMNAGKQVGNLLRKED